MLATALALSGCTAGSDFLVPDLVKDAGYTRDRLTRTVSVPTVAGGAAQRFVIGSEVNPAWWTLFRSRQIDALVREAVRNHPDIAAAQAALRSARETSLSAEGGLLPSLSASHTSERARSAATQGAPASIYSLHNASVDVSYGLDLFGGTRRQIEARRAEAEYQRFQLEATYLTLTANVVTAALTDASLQAQIAATQDIARLQREQLVRIQQQFSLGAVPASDVLSQQSTLAQTEATLPALQKQRALQRNELMAYLGRMPNQDRGESVNLADLKLPPTVPVSLPSNLVRQRPDIRAAEATLHAATASVGVAIADMLPQLSLSGSYSTSAASPGQMFSADSIAWSVAGSVTQKIFDGGTLYHSKEASVATYEQDLAKYKSTVLTAFQDVADSLRAIQYDAKALEAQTAAEKAARASLDMAEEQYKTGAVDYPTVASAQETYQNAVVSRVKAQATRFTDTVALYQSLGGGWWNRNDETAAAQPRHRPGRFAGIEQSVTQTPPNTQNKKVQTQ
jgi:NodT family efflux transporter outer membrane factor (OMF) lipoprotein